MPALTLKTTVTFTEQFKACEISLIVLGDKQNEVSINVQDTYTL